MVFRNYKIGRHIKWYGLEFLSISSHCHKVKVSNLNLTHSSLYVDVFGGC